MCTFKIYSADPVGWCRYFVQSSPRWFQMVSWSNDLDYLGVPLMINRTPPITIITLVSLPLHWELGKYFSTPQRAYSRQHTRRSCAWSASRCCDLLELARTQNFFGAGCLLSSNRIDFLQNQPIIWMNNDEHHSDLVISTQQRSKSCHDDFQCWILVSKCLDAMPQPNRPSLDWIHVNLGIKPTWSIWSYGKMAI